MIVKDEWALITGASSGIGADIARELAARSCNCILLARREDRLLELAEELRSSHSVQCEIIALDLCESNAAQRVFDQVQSSGHGISFLVNNAGFGMHGEFLKHPLDELQNMLHLNNLVAMQLCHLFAQSMVQAGKGRILNVASVAGKMPVASYAAYGASKAFLISLSEALSIELQASGVSVTVLCPGSTATEFYNISGQDERTFYSKIMMMKSADVASIGVKAALNGKVSVIAGWRNSLSVGAMRFFPDSFVRWLTAIFMRNNS